MAGVGLVLFGRLIRAVEGIYILFNTMTNVVPVGEAFFHLSSFFYVAIYSQWTNDMHFRYKIGRTILL